MNNMIEDFFADIVKKLPRAKIPVPGVKGWVQQGLESQLVFFEINESVRISPHTHGPQFGFIIEGKAEIKIEGNVHKLTAGSYYYIPAGSVHEAVFDTFTRAVDLFFETNRYETEPT
ncbi:MAG: cupin domain-containing protein [Candidatus Thorarchaeota archaeon]|nr:MAG: cupin domain-containing protein [Candidatus Thorarchaeota archaeon]